MIKDVDECRVSEQTGRVIGESVASSGTLSRLEIRKRHVSVEDSEVEQAECALAGVQKANYVTALSLCKLPDT